jgi:putative membrane protein
MRARRRRSTDCPVAGRAMRIDPVVTFTYVVVLAAPFAAYASVRRVRRGEHRAHRAIQIATLVVCWIAVLALELRIRLGGGSGSLVATAPLELQPAARALLLVHIAFAIATFGVWTWLVVASSRRFTRALPGSFSRRHKRAGKLVIGGLCFTAASATGMYAITTFA